MNPGLKLLAISLLALFLARSTTQASLIFLYDFPNDSGLAADQTNPQPSGATFGDWQRSNVTQVPNSGDTFGSNNWSQGTTLDSTVFESFSITADSGFHLNLSSLTFSAYRSATGPQDMEVALFLNGSITAYATYDFSPTTSTASYAFNFTPLTDGDNVIAATFKFYGWNAQGMGGQLYLDDVGTYGGISNVPEPSSLLPILILLGFILNAQKRARPVEVTRSDAGSSAGR